MEYVIFSAQAVKPGSPVNQPPSSKMSQSGHRLPTVTSEQQTAEKSQEEPEVFQNDASYEKKFLRVSPHLKE